jgi:Domain of unknown function (DUF4277)
MQALSPASAVYPVHHLPILQADADPLGLVSLLKHAVPTAMEVEAGTGGLALGLATLRGRSPLSRLEEVCAQHDTALLFGTTVPPPALNDATAGRGLDRLYDFGTMRLCTAWAVRAATRFGWERRSVHFDPTSPSVWGADQCAEPQALPLQGP